MGAAPIWPGSVRFGFPLSEKGQSAITANGGLGVPIACVVKFGSAVWAKPLLPPVLALALQAQERGADDLLEAVLLEAHTQYEQLEEAVTTERGRASFLQG